MAIPFRPAFPWLLYACPWLPYPRVVTIYLREKGIPPSLVQLVQCKDPSEGMGVIDAASSLYPPRPSGSVPVLLIPSEAKDENGRPRSWTHIRQSMAMIRLMEEMCNANLYGFPASARSMLGDDAMERARVQEVTTLAEELMVSFNPVRTFGTNAGTMSIPAAAKEMLRWVRRTTTTIEEWWAAENRDMSVLQQNGAAGHITLGDIVLFNFLEFISRCYGLDLTVGTGETIRDVYGREKVEHFPKLREFFEAFGTRESVRRDAAIGEAVPEKHLKNMQTWAQGVL